jgi:hypothetical protein
MANFQLSLSPAQSRLFFDVSGPAQKAEGNARAFFLGWFL